MLGENFLLQLSARMVRMVSRLSSPIFLKTRAILFRFLFLPVCIQFAIYVSAGKAQNGSQLSLDVAQYQDKDHRSYMDVYYSVPRSSVGYALAKGGGYSCQLLFRLQIYHEGGLWASKMWKVEETIADSAHLQTANQLVDLIRYQTDAAGHYRVVLHIQDLHRSSHGDSVSVEVDLRQFSPDEVEMSDLQLASTITSAAGSPTIFTKQVYEVIPNVAALFGESAVDLYYYFEAYHLLKNISSRKYKTVSYVEGTAGKAGEELSASHIKQKRFDSIVEVGRMNVSRLPTGSYRLVAGIADSAGTMITSREKKFFVYNPAVTEELAAGRRGAGSTAVGPLQTLSEKELDDEFDRMIYVASRAERDMYKSLKSAEAKREFVSSLWQSPRNGDALNGLAYREQYLARARETETRFKSPARPGWKSDRGRVFILYGPADRLDRFPSSTTSLPYETWTYDHLKGQGGVVFIFADRMGFNNYEQVHSTLQGELQDPSWQQLITRGSSGENRINELQ